jgi:peptide/nickel transport system substrate-binding protein
VKRLAALTALTALTALAVAGCSGSSGGGKSGGKSGSKVVDNATFNLALTSDPGNLDPQSSAASNLYQLSFFAYDPLLNLSPDNKIVSGLAQSWKTSGNSVVLTLHKGITCSDGSAFGPEDVVKNVTYVADPKNKSPFLGTFLPGGSKATADAAAGTVTITTPTLAPFLLEGLASIPIVCAKGLTDRKSLAHATDGTGPYQLSEAVSGDHYTYTKRAGYAWGPGGASTAAKGLPAKIVVKIVQNMTTTANLLLAGSLNGAYVNGADAKRLTAAHLFHADVQALQGEMWFNQAKGRIPGDAAVRKALTQALDLAQLQKVLTSGDGAPATQLAAAAPTACPGNSVKSAVPATDVAAAKQMLDNDGWTAGSGGVRSKGGKQLALTLLYNTGLGTGGSAAAELAAQMWKAVGAKVTLKPQDDTAAVQTLFGSGNWDIAWVTVNVNSPDQMVPFLSGPAVPNGNNFAHISNSAYSAGVAKAAKIQGAAGCSDWLAAEGELYQDADVVPFANQVRSYFGKKAQFQVVGWLVPTSIRMLAG